MLKVEFNGIGDLEIGISGMLDVFDDFEPWFIELVDEVLIEEIEDIFESDGRGTWPPRVDDKPHDLLRLSFALYDSLTGRGNPDNFTKITPFSLEYGSDVFYHDFHEFDEVAPNIPARPVLQFLEQIEFDRKVEQHFEDWLRQRIRELRL